MGVPSHLSNLATAARRYLNDVRVLDVTTFVWSRMRSIDERDPSKLRHLLFTDFLENLCRLAVSKSMPTDEDIAAMAASDLEQSCDDGGEYIFRLQQENAGVGYDDFVAKHTKGLLESSENPYQPLHRALEHLITFLLRTVLGKHRGKCDMKLPQKVAARWGRSRR